MSDQTYDLITIGGGIGGSTLGLATGPSILKTDPFS